MNNDSMHHLDLETLLAAADGALDDERMKAHLTSCSACRREVDSWRTVGLGARHLVAGVVPPGKFVVDRSPVSGHGSAGAVVTPTGAGHVGRGLRRRSLIGGAAAAVLVIALGSFGLVEALGGGGAPPVHVHARSGASAGLTAVNGCPDLAAVSGTLTALNGSNLVIETPDGQSVTVTASSSTGMIGAENVGTLADVSDGAQVVVNGTGSNGTITASTVTVGAVDNVKPFEPPRPSETPVTIGTVTDAHTGGFTVVDANGTSVAVVTTSSTAVITLRALTVQQLQIGGYTVAVGNTQGQGGTLVAGAIEQVPHPISFPQGPSSAKANQAGCSPQSVVTAVLTATH